MNISQFLRIPIVEHLLRLIPDRQYISLMYRKNMGKWPNLENPVTFSEKIQWLKLYDRRPEYITMVDKYAVKEYVAKIIGEDYITPTLGVWKRPEEIDFDNLPNQFVLKWNHDSGSIVICKDKNKFDKEAAIKKLKRGAKVNGYWYGREWPYKGVKPLLIAEKYIDPSPNVEDLPDYNWYCFNGEPKYCQVIQDRSSKETIDFFDTEWNHQEFVGLNPAAGPAAVTPTCPKNLSVHLKIARELSKNIPFARIDLYETDNKTFFGEITFYPLSGMGEFNPEKYNEILGKMITLPGENGGGVIIRLKDNDEIEVSQPDLPDYKFFCFNGEPQLIQLDFDRFEGHKKNLYSKDWNLMPFSFNYPSHPERHFEKPQKLDEMLDLARKLSNGTYFSRIDFYWVNGNVYFGEITFYPASGVGRFTPDIWDRKLGDMLMLPI